MKSALYRTVAFAGLALAAPFGVSASADEAPVVAPAEAGLVTPQWGNLETFWGNLETFEEGETSANWGNLETFWGNLETFWGNLETFYGPLDPTWGNLETFWGNLETFEGSNYAYWGNLETFWGNLETFQLTNVPFWGNLETFWGNLETFEGTNTVRWGNLETFWGNLETFSTEYAEYDGDYSAYYGSLDPSWGNLETFWGNLETFDGNLDSSWGNLETFGGNLETFEGDLGSYWGNLETFWGNLETFWGNLETFWGNLETFGPENEAQYAELLGMLGAFYNLSQDQWAIPVALDTKQDFYAGFAQAMFEKYGIDPTDPSSLSDWSAVDRAKFFVEWYDGLMQFSGIDRVDSWMAQVNWSPALTQDHDFNTQAVIGLLDFGVTDQTLLTHDVVYSGGYDTDADDTHGSAVVSLLIAPHDGKGIMGIAPGAGVAVYNPFDETDTAGWEDIETGINALIDNDARIINMSLGVPGQVLSEDWSEVLANVLTNPNADGTIFVKAAGNEGTVQTDDIDWASAEALERLILVGSTGINGEIASWSNTPGDACVIVDGACSALMNNFIVAPGEFILTSDGAGGVTRVAGSSFSAPLVSGTAALIHGAWPWWREHGEETVDVILQSATDLGEEGVDGTYGWGMLNVEGALSPLDWDGLTFHFARKADGRLSRGMNSDWIRLAYWVSDVLRLDERGAYVVGVERVGDTFRDFRIPLSTQLYGTSVGYEIDGERRFQRHLHDRFVDWATGASFGDVQSYEANLGVNGDWALSMAAAPFTPGTDVRDGQLPFQSDMILRQAASGTEFRIGFGDGAARLSDSPVFGFYSDHRLETGGVNPILGLASGGTYASSTMPLSDRMSVTTSITETSNDHSYIDPLTGLRIQDDNGISDFAAQAANIGVQYRLIDGVNLKLDYTQLHERDSLLGGQGAGFLALDGGAITDAVTFGTDIQLPAQFALGLSATMGETRATRFDEGFLSIADGGLTSTAFAIGLRRDGVFSDEDAFRLTIAQPLRLEAGGFEFTSLEVVNRTTGELGQVTQVWGLADTAREYNVEASYGAPIMGGTAEMSAFTRADMNMPSPDGSVSTEFAFGGRLSIRY